MGAVGAHIALVEEVPQVGVDLVGLVHGEGDAGLGHAPPFLLDLLALLALQAGQEGGEVGIRGRRVLGPVELHALARQPALGGDHRGLVGLMEQQVHR